jgi:predicted metal-dependent hydrolase
MSLPYTLIRSKRRSLSLQINKHGELIARAPIRMNVDFIEDFIERKKDWIKKHQTRIVNSAQNTVHTKEYSDKEIQEMKQKLREYIIPRVQELWE